MGDGEERARYTSYMTQPAPEAQLLDLMLQCFTGTELRRWVEQGPYGRTLTRYLPGPIASDAEVAWAVVQLHCQHGWLDDAFFVRLAEERPAFSEDIAKTRAAWASRPPDEIQVQVGNLAGQVHVAVTGQALGLHLRVEVAPGTSFHALGSRLALRLRRLSRRLDISLVAIGSAVSGRARITAWPPFPSGQETWPHLSVACQELVPRPSPTNSGVLGAEEEVLLMHHVLFLEVG